MKAHKIIIISLALAIFPAGLSFAEMGETAEADPMRSESEEADLLWGTGRDVIPVLRKTSAERVDRHYEEGDTVEKNIRLNPFPRDILPALNPFSELDLHFVLSTSEASIVLPRTRRVLKVYRSDAPEAEIIKVRTPAPGAAPQAAQPPREKPVSAAPQRETRVEEVKPADDRPQGIDRSKARQTASPGSDAVRLLLERADARRKLGDILGTRQFLEHAARLGSADAIFRLAQTYDARVLASWGARGVKPDESKAQQLYSDAEVIAGIAAKGSVRADNGRD